jgi:hypothetical protein
MTQTTQFKMYGILHFPQGGITKKDKLNLRYLSLNQTLKTRSISNYIIDNYYQFFLFEIIEIDSVTLRLLFVKGVKYFV